MLCFRKMDNVSAVVNGLQAIAQYGKEVAIVVVADVMGQVI